MHLRLGVLPFVLVAMCGMAAFVAVGRAGALDRPQLLQCLEQIPTVLGTPGDDVLTGTFGDDVIVGLGGDDVIAGREGHDVICGGDGNDRIVGGPGLFESDVISGDAGDDAIVAGSTASVAVYAFSPAAIMVDLELGTAAGWGADALVGVHNIVGSGFADVIRGAAGFNCLHGGAGNDTLLALDGDDCLYGGRGNDTLDGGLGSDVLEFQHVRNPMVVNLAAGFARGEGFDRVAAVERVVGTSLPDVITGDVEANELTGGGGADRLAGGPGADRLDGGVGRDRVDGGIGLDRCLNAERRSRCP
jgi:Ca2+-binding RTX toxin-like protein